MLYALIGAWLLNFIQPIRYSIAVNHIRIQQRRAIRNGDMEDDSRLIQLSVPAQEFKKAYREDKREISLNGNMYDIVLYRSDGDIVHCIALEDEAESALHNQFTRNIDGKHSPTPKPIVFFWLYALHNDITLTLALFFVPLAPEMPETSDKLSCGYARFISHPPEAFLI